MGPYGSLYGPYGSLWVTLWLLWVTLWSLWSLWVTVWVTLWSLWVPKGSLYGPYGHYGSPYGPYGSLCITLWVAMGHPMGHSGPRYGSLWVPLWVAVGHSPGAAQPPIPPRRPPPPPLWLRAPGIQRRPAVGGGVRGGHAHRRGSAHPSASLATPTSGGGSASCVSIGCSSSGWAKGVGLA